MVRIALHGLKGLSGFSNNNPRNDDRKQSLYGQITNYWVYVTEHTFQILKYWSELN